MRAGRSKVALGGTIHVHDPIGARAIGSTALVENQGLFHANQAVTGPDGAVLTGAFPVAYGGGPYQLLGFRRKEIRVIFYARITSNVAARIALITSRSERVADRLVCLRGAESVMCQPRPEAWILMR